MTRGRRLQQEKGQALVEFALILPVFLTLVVGIVGFGIGLSHWLDLTHTANQGARYASVNLVPVCTGSAATPCPGNKNFNTFLRGELTASSLAKGGTSSVPNPAGVTVCYTDENGNGQPEIGEPVTVKMTVKYKFLPFIRLSVDLVGKATMRMEQLPTRLTGQTASTPSPAPIPADVLWSSTC